MAIKTDVTNDNEMPLVLFQDDLQATPYILPKAEINVNWCWCDYFCQMPLPVFAGDDNDYDNDRSDFPFYRVGPSDTVTMKLFKDGVEKATLNNNTYGVYYDFGSSYNPNFKGYRIDWGLVYAAFGSGIYQVKTTQVLLNVSFTRYSSFYSLSAYNEVAADGTVRIESYHNGRVESSPIDFTGMNWYSQIRVWGKLLNGQPDYIQDNYISSDRQEKQIQAQMIDNFQLEVFHMTADERRTFIKQTLLANDLLLTDYSVANEDKYKQLSLVIDGIEKLKYNSDRPGSHAVIKLKEKKQDTIKRNSIFS